MEQMINNDEIEQIKKTQKFVTIGLKKETFDRLNAMHNHLGGYDAAINEYIDFYESRQVDDGIFEEDEDERYE
jgi:hypothetical protein